MLKCEALKKHLLHFVDQLIYMDWEGAMDQQNNKKNHFSMIIFNIKFFNLLIKISKNYFLNESIGSFTNPSRTMVHPVHPAHKMIGCRVDIKTKIGRNI